MDSRVPERYLWMDRLRGTAVLLVIVWHAVSIPTFFGLPMPAVVEFVNDAVSPFRIPALLILSGLLLQASLRKPLDRYYFGKISHVVWPLLVWGAIYLLANPGVDGSTVDYWLGGSYLWYLVVVAACYAIGPIVRWVPPLLLAAVIIGAVLLVPTFNPVLSPILEYAPYFFLGAAAQPISTRILGAPGWLVAIPATIAVVGAFFLTLHYGYSPRIHVIALPISLLGIACLAWALNRLPALPRLEWVGRHSLHLYVAHFPIMVLACRFGVMELPAPVVYLLLLALGIAGATVLARFLPGAPLFALPFSLRRAKAVDGARTGSARRDS